MRLLAINASHRADQGNTKALIDHLFEGANRAGAECENITLAHYKLQRCLGCEKCQTSEKERRCVWDEHDDARAIFARMAAADLIIYATPVYIFNLSSLLKILFERMNGICDTRQPQLSECGYLFHSIDRAVCSKPFVSLVCCDNLEDETWRNIQVYFQTFSHFMDAPQVGALVRNGCRLASPVHPSQENAIHRRLESILAAYEQAGRELALEGRIRRATQARANQEIIPLPGFHWLKKIRFHPVQQKFLDQAEKFQSGKPLSPHP